MKASITSYRRGRHTTQNNQIVLKTDDVKSREEAKKKVGKKVTYKTSGGKEIIGKVSHPHGNKGAMLARFKKGLPGQAIGEEVEIKE